MRERERRQKADQKEDFEALGRSTCKHMGRDHCHHAIPLSMALMHLHKLMRCPLRHVMNLYMFTRTHTHIFIYIFIYTHLNIRILIILCWMSLMWTWLSFGQRRDELSNCLYIVNCVHLPENPSAENPLQVRQKMSRLAQCWFEIPYPEFFGVLTSSIVGAFLLAGNNASRNLAWQRDKKH